MKAALHRPTDDTSVPAATVRVSSVGVLTLTPANIATWEAELIERTQMCADIVGWPKAILTIYAGPDDRGGRPVAVVTGLDDATYVSRHAGEGSTESWIHSILDSVGTESHPFGFPARISR